MIYDLRSTTPNDELGRGKNPGWRSGVWGGRQHEVNVWHVVWCIIFLHEHLHMGTDAPLESAFTAMTSVGAHCFFFFFALLYLYIMFTYPHSQYGNCCLSWKFAKMVEIGSYVFAGLEQAIECGSLQSRIKRLKSHRTSL